MGQFLRILPVTVADACIKQCRQAGIAVQKPSAEGDAVGLVIEFFRIKLVESMQLGLL